MSHAKPDDLRDIKVLLTNLRENDRLKEKSVGCFYLKSKSVVHFHVKGERRFAHVFDGKGWQEVDIKPTPSAAEQVRISKSIQGLLPT